ncbi:MAG: hypothetical protein K0S39_4569 [Paenibacillus sp.]|jgi:hypothetical protein|nr:hypothetical protein [Paenibacillus sp.]
MSTLHEQPAAKIGQWDRFETSIENLNSYKYPYHDVSLDVTYTRPDGGTIRFWGFYDGGTTWKVRCMPDQIGLWSYEAVFSDGSPGKSGSFECIPSHLPGLIHKDEINPMWFGYKGGKHVMVRSFHVGDAFFAENISDDKRKTFLDWVQSYGYNMLSLASHYMNRQSPGRGLGWKTPKLWPLDAAEYRKMERILDELAERRILVFPFAGFFGRESFFPNAERDQVHYVKYTIARIGVYWNMLFNVAGPEPVLCNNPFMVKSEVDRLGKLIRSCNAFGQLITVHNETGDDVFRREDYIDYVTLQGPKTRSRDVMSYVLLRNHPKYGPLYAQETLWPGNIHGHPKYTDEDIRKNAFVATMSAAAINYADHNGDSSSGFSGSLDPEDAVVSRHQIIKHIWDFFETVEFYRMSPHQNVVDKGYCLAEIGKQYLVYLESGGSVNIDVVEGIYSVEWINARDTSDRRTGERTWAGQNLQAPDQNDWLVYLVSIG